MFWASCNNLAARFSKVPLQVTASNKMFFRNYHGLKKQQNFILISLEHVQKCNDMRYNWLIHRTNLKLKLCSHIKFNLSMYIILRFTNCLGLIFMFRFYIKNVFSRKNNFSSHWIFCCTRNACTPSRFYITAPFCSYTSVNNQTAWPMRRKRKRFFATPDQAWRFL